MLSVLMGTCHYFLKPAFLVGGLGVFCALLGCDSGYSESPQAEAPPSRSVAYQGRPSVGSRAPDFRLMDLHGKAVSLSDYQGKVVLLNFWATWCGPCRVEMPAMEALYRSMQSKGLEILAVSVDQEGTAVTRPFQEALGLSFPILHDQDYQVGLTYGARTLPMTFAIDRKGIIRQLVFGSRDWNSPEARRGIAEVLQESTPESSQRM
jgi:peroxiredoxin